MNILAFDPGGTTGWTLYSDETIVGGQLAGQHHYDLYLLMRDYDPNVIVYETFEYRNKSRAGLVLDSREYIGIIKLYAEINEVDIIAQTPAQAKGFVTDDKLKKMKLYYPGMPHMCDAMRHLVYYIVNHTELPLRTELLEKAYK